MLIIIDHILRWLIHLIWYHLNVISYFLYFMCLEVKVIWFIIPITLLLKGYLSWICILKLLLLNLLLLLLLLLVLLILMTLKMLLMSGFITYVLLFSSHLHCVLTSKWIGLILLNIFSYFIHEDYIIISVNVCMLAVLNHWIITTE